jgi:hypothetical protein
VLTFVFNTGERDFGSQQGKSQQERTSKQELIISEHSGINLFP